VIAAGNSRNRIEIHGWDGAFAKGVRFITSGGLHGAIPRQEIWNSSIANTARPRQERIVEFSTIRSSFVF
jgi:hypothetical protein